MADVKMNAEITKSNSNTRTQYATQIWILRNFCAITGTEFCTILCVSIVTHFIWQEDKLDHRRFMVCVLPIKLHPWLAKTTQWVKENSPMKPLAFPKLHKFHSYYSAETHKIK
jgi:hypothetical protein